MENMSSTIRDIYRDLHNDFFAAIENIKEYIEKKGDRKDIQYKLQQLESEMELSYCLS